MLDLNPSLVDQDKIRKLRRKRLLKVILLPTLILVLIGIFFLRTTFFNIIYSLSYENQNYNTAKFLTDEQKVGNIISPYVAYFDTGTINLKREQYKEAEESFREALRNNPPNDIICQVYVNLSLSIEKQGDLLVEAENYEEALVMYNSAQSILYEHNCANKNDSDDSKDKKASAADSRIANKRSQTVAYMNYIEQSNEETDDGDISPVSEENISNIKNNRNPEKIIDHIRNGRGYGAGDICTPSGYDKCW